MSNTITRERTRKESVSGNALRSPRFMRLPKTGERDPLFGQTRSYLNTLVLPSEANEFEPPVKSYVLKKKGARTGVRLIDIESLTSFILKHEQQPGKPLQEAA